MNLGQLQSQLTHFDLSIAFCHFCCSWWKLFVWVDHHLLDPVDHVEDACARRQDLPTGGNLTLDTPYQPDQGPSKYNQNHPTYFFYFFIIMSFQFDFEFDFPSIKINSLVTQIGPGDIYNLENWKNILVGKTVGH